MCGGTVTTAARTSHEPPGLTDLFDTNPLLALVTQNLCSVKTHAQSTFQLNMQIRPSLFFGQEHKRPPRENKARWIRDVFAGFSLHMSCWPCHTAPCLRRTVA